jgi:hypothetical protein
MIIKKHKKQLAFYRSLIPVLAEKAGFKKDDTSWDLIFKKRINNNNYQIKKNTSGWWCLFENHHEIFYGEKEVVFYLADIAGYNNHRWISKEIIWGF